jgi:hypothetical protein
MFSKFRKYALTKLDEWTSVLHLSSKWDFESIRSLALRELLPLASPVDKIVLGRKYGFDDWLTPAFVAVCARAEPLSLAEAEKMSNADVTRIFQARERARSSNVSVDSSTAEEAVGCIFSEGDEPAVAINIVINESSSSSATSDVKLPTETSRLEDEPTESLPTDLPAGVEEVDDGLMDALLVWSRVCSRLDDSDFEVSPRDPSYRAYARHHPVILNYKRYKADYQSLLAYAGSPQLQVTSLCHFLFVTLQKCSQSKRPELYVQFWKDLRNQMDATLKHADGVLVVAPLGMTDFDRVLEERCLEFVSNECALADTHSNPFKSRQAPAWLVSNLANAGLLNDQMMRACFLHVVPPPKYPEPSESDLKHLLALLQNSGKGLDRACCRDLMDNIFKTLRQHVLDWKFRDLHQQILVSACSSRVSC